MVYARLVLMRLFKAVIVLFLIVIFNFLLIQMAPGDPAASSPPAAAKPPPTEGLGCSRARPGGGTGDAPGTSTLLHARGRSASRRPPAPPHPLPRARRRVGAVGEPATGK